MTKNKKKSQEQVFEDYRVTKTCPQCGMPLTDPASTLGHTKPVCRRYKATMAREAAAKAKGVNKATKK